jgi:protein phosphatase
MNCGDSRIYRFRDGQLTQLSTDHSLSNIMGRDCRSGVITNCIGGGCKTSYIDMVQITSSIASSDVYLLCSDGLSDMLSNDEIERLLAEGADATSLCNAAEEAGGLDNVSVVVVHVE